MSDLIDRQAAIDAARDWYEGLICGSFEGLEKRLRALPSAQPEPCEDAVSRKAAVAKVNEYASIWMEYTEGMSKDEIAQAALDSAKQTMNRILSELPSVTLKRRTGKWIDVDVMGMPAQACDQCNTFYPLAYTGGGHHYCPNCGAKMEVTE